MKAMVKIKINKFGLIGIIRKSFEQIGISKLIKEVNRIRVLIYVSGLIALSNPTTTNISKQFCCVSHDSLTRELEVFRWLNGEFCVKYIQSIQSQKAVLGYLIIDDTVIEKPYATFIAGLSCVYDSCSKKPVPSLNLLPIFWTDGTVKILVGFRLWEPKIYAKPYKTKIQLAMELIKDVHKQGLKVDYVTFDAWYAARKLMKVLRKCNYHWVTKVKSNRNFIFNNEVISAKEISLKFTKNQYHYYPSIDLYIRTVKVKLRGYGGLLKMAIVKNGRNAQFKNIRFILTDMEALTSVQIVRAYQNRWSIEVVFKELKQLLGLEKCQMQSWNKIIGHIEMTFLAYCLLDFIKLQLNVNTMPELVKYLQGFIDINIDEGKYFLLSTYPVTINEENIFKNIPSLEPEQTTFWDRLGSDSL